MSKSGMKSKELKREDIVYSYLNFGTKLSRFETIL